MARSFRFVPVRKKALSSILDNGLNGSMKAYSSLKKARAAGGRVLVVPEDAFREGLVKAKEILNLSPYRRAVPVVAGGGVLIRRKKNRVEVVLIHRKGRWDLPKGKRDRGETNRACAVREVQEELGIETAEIMGKLGTTVHGYRARKRRFVVKTTHWYSMATQARTFVPEAKERITDARWVPLDDAIRMLGYKPLKKLLRKVRTQLVETAAPQR